MRPTLGSLPQMAVLTRGELTTPLPMARATASLGAPRDRDPDDVVDALAVADHVLGQVGAHGVQRGGEARPVGAGDGARRQQRHGVGGAGVAVDADAVEAAVDRPPAAGARSSSRGTCRSVSR